MNVKNKHKRWSEEKISSAVLIVLLAMSIAVFMMFYGIGYDEPWEENTEFISPAHTDSLINFLIGIGVLTCLTAFASALWFVRCQGHALNIRHRIPSAGIACGVIIITIISIFISFAASSDSMMMINGKAYSDKFWLCTSDVLIYTAEIMLVFATATIIIGGSGISRKIKRN